MILVFSYYYIQAKKLRNDKIQHKALFEYNSKIEIRNWIIKMGGVYFHDTDSGSTDLFNDFSDTTYRNAANSSVKRIEADLVLKLISEHNDSIFGTSSKVISWKYNNPDFKPDSWELKALDTLKAGKKIYKEIFDGKLNLYRELRPMYMEVVCANCHHDTGLKTGDLLGAISMKIDLREINAQFYSSIKAYLITFLIIWVIGIFGFVVAYRRILKREKERNNALTELERVKDLLEENVEQKSTEIIKANRLLKSQIAEKQKLLETLEVNELRYRNIVEHSSNMFYSHDINHKLNYVSPKCEKFLDCTAEEAKTNWTTFITNNPINKLGFEKTQKAIDTATAQEPFQLELKTKLGRKLWVEVHEAPVVRNGKTIAIVGALHDITERKRTEEKLIFSEAKFKELFNSAPDGIMYLDKQGYILNCNPAGANMFGYTVAELMSKNISETLGEENMEFYMKKFPEFLEKGSLLIEKIKIPKKNGGYIYVRRHAKAIKNGESVVGIIVHSQDITSMVEASDKIAINETNLNQIQEIAGIGNYTFYFDTNKGEISNYLKNLLELQSVDSFGLEELINIVSEEDQNWVREKLSLITESGYRQFDIVHRVVSKETKRVYWVRHFGELTLNTEDKPQKILGSIQNINEQYKSQKLIKEREEHLRAIFKAASEISFITTTTEGSDSVILSVSPGTEKLFGYKKEELIGKKVKILHTEEDIDDFEENRKRMEAGEPGFLGEAKMRKKSGELINVYHRAFPLKFDDDKLKTALGVTMDLSEITQTRSDLAKREEQLDLLLNADPDLIYFKDANGRWILANDTTINVLKLEKLNYINKTNEELIELSSHLKESLESETELDNKAWETKSTYRSEIKLIANNRQSIFDVIRVPLFEDDGKRKGMLIYGRDISETKELSDKLLNAKKLEAVGLMASRLAHEFKNILQSISGYSQFALEGLNAKSSNYKDIQEVLSAADKANNLVKNLLTIPRNFELNPSPFNIIVSVKEFSHSVGNSLGEKLIFKTILPPEKVINVNLDKAYLEMVLLNITLNAKDAISDNGEIVLKVELRNPSITQYQLYPWLVERDYVCISVKDNGSGMTEDVVSKIFEPFYTTKKPGKGTGLGLSSSYDIVKLLSGFIDVESTPAKGSEFFIYLPLA